jgi:hypothetical protein
MSQEETSNKRDKKMETKTKKRRDPNRHCKHFEVDVNMEEMKNKCWKLYSELHSKWLKSKGKAKESIEMKKKWWKEPLI